MSPGPCEIECSRTFVPRLRDLCREQVPVCRPRTTSTQTAGLASGSPRTLTLLPVLHVHRSPVPPLGFPVGVSDFQLPYRSRGTPSQTHSLPCLLRPRNTVLGVGKRGTETVPTRRLRRESSDFPQRREKPWDGPGTRRPVCEPHPALV